MTNHEKYKAAFSVLQPTRELELEDPMMNNQKKITLSTTWATIRAYNKINFNSTICYNDGSNWIVGVGSFIYKSKSGEEALSMIISEFSVKKIPDLKKEIRGIYSFAIYKNEVVYFFNDYYGLFETIFGIVEEKGYFVGTNWADIIGFNNISSTGTQGVFRCETCYNRTDLEGAHWHDNNVNAMLGSKISGTEIHTKNNISLLK